MNKNIKLLIALIVLVAIAALLYNFRSPKQVDTNTDTPATTTTSGKDSMVKYENTTNAISFEYPSSLYLKENLITATTSPQFAVVLVRDTQENRDVLDGKSPIAREAPPAIVVQVVDNSAHLTANELALAKTNLNLATSATSSVHVRGQNGVQFTWSGLYEGKSIIVTHDDRAYVFSVTWMSANDQLIKDFNMILNTVSLK